MNEETNEAAAQEVSIEQKLAAVHKRIMITVIFCCVGWPVFLAGFTYQAGMIVMALGAIIVSGPILFRLWKGGIGGAFKTDEYEVVTTYSDGSKRSDGGSESFLMGLLIKLFLGIVLIIIGCLVTIGYLLFLIVRYIMLYLKASEKPALLKSAFLWMALGLGVLIASGPILRLIF